MNDVLIPSKQDEGKNDNVTEDTIKPIQLPNRPVYRVINGVFAVKPGLTGLAQICGRDKIDYREKAAIHAEYVQKCSVKLDLRYLFRTVSVVFTGEGVM